MDAITRKVSRVGRPSPPPTSFEGGRYEEIQNGSPRGLGQRTGLLAVIDEASNQRVTAVRVYDYPRREGLESDAGDVFFVSMQLDVARREIVIASEHGSVHKLP